jgi:alpha-beta hydrolase superfamily lysophospholipase
MKWRRWLIGRWTWWRPIASLASIYGLLWLVAVFFADRVIFVPPPASYPDNTPGLVWIDMPRGGKIAAFHLPAEKGAPTLLYSHGNAEDIGHSLEIFQAWHQMGIGVLAYDYPGYGHSSGWATEETTHQSIHAAWQYLLAQRVPRDSVVIVGRSVGSGPSTRLAAEVHPAGLVLIAPFTSAFEVAFPVKLFPADRFRNIDLIGGFASPLLVIHARHDEVIPFSHGQRIIDASAASQKKLLVIEHAGHNDLFEVSGREIIDAIADFARQATAGD